MEHINYVRIPYTLQRAIIRHENMNYLGISYTVIRLLTTGIRSEKCVVRRFRRANVIQCTYTNLDSIAYYAPGLYGIT